MPSVAHATVEPVDTETRTAVEQEYQTFLDDNAIPYAPVSVACAIGQDATNPAGPMLGLCYANNEAPGVIAHAAMSLDGVTWVFVDAQEELEPAGASTVAAGPATSFGDGNWLVGTDVAPGQYRAPGGSLCYWARLADLSGEDIIANQFSDTNSQVLVEIQATDVTFETNGCGTWEPIWSVACRPSIAR